MLNVKWWLESKIVEDWVIRPGRKDETLLWPKMKEQKPEQISEYAVLTVMIKGSDGWYVNVRHGLSKNRGLMLETQITIYMCQISVFLWYISRKSKFYYSWKQKQLNFPFDSANHIVIVSNSLGMTELMLQVVIFFEKKALYTLWPYTIKLHKKIPYSNSDNFSCLLHFGFFFIDLFFFEILKTCPM